MVLRVYKGITNETHMAHDADEFVGRHSIPLMAIHLGVIHLNALC